jgi:MYXO-CTERM domain-containing protein
VSAGRLLLPPWFAWLACSSALEPEPTERAHATVVNGHASPSGTREDGVLQMRTAFDDGELACSAALVAENLVVTARHCVAHSTREAFTCTIRGELVEPDAQGGRLGLDVRPDALTFYADEHGERQLVARGAEILSTLTESMCVDDLAFVILDRALDLPVFPLRLRGAARIGEHVGLTGYGLDGEMGFDTPFDALRRNTNDELEVFDVGPNAAEDATSAPPRTVLVDGPAGCVGDSGAPLYSAETGAVIGIYSMLAGNSCTGAEVRHFFPHLPAYAALISTVFRAAGAEPLAEDAPDPTEPEPNAAGAAGSGDAGSDARGDAGAAGASGLEDSGAGGDAGSPPRADSEGGSTAPNAAAAPSEGSGCSVAGNSQGAPPSAALLVLGAVLHWRRRQRAQRRPSNGSSSSTLAGGAALTFRGLVRG